VLFREGANDRLGHFCRRGRIRRVVEIQQQNAHERIVQAEEGGLKVRRRRIANLGRRGGDGRLGQLP